MKIIFFLLSLFIFYTANAQSHNMGANYNCKFRKGNSTNIEKNPCPGCEAKDKKENAAKIAENKKSDQAVWDKAKADNDVKQKAFQEKNKSDKLEDDKSKERVVYAGNSKSSGSDDSNQEPKKIPDSYKGNPMTYNSNTNSGTTGLDKFSKGLEQGQQIVNIVTQTIDLFKPSKAALQRRDEANRKKEEEKRKIEIQQTEESIVKMKRAEFYEGSLRSEIKKYIVGANNGDMILQMKLLFEKAMHESKGEIDLSHLLPDWKQRLIDAANKNYFDAINLIGTYSLYYHPSPLDFTLEEGLNMLKYSADLGNVESMLILANYYDQEKEYAKGGGDAVKALFWYKTAEKKNSQYAMFRLGKIYRYNNATGLEYRVKYNITNNDTALMYFKKALDFPPLFQSAFQSSFGYLFRSDYSEHTTIDSYKELSIMYRDGLGCVKDNTKVEVYSKLCQYPFEGYRINRDAFENFIKGEYSDCLQKLDKVDSLLLQNNKTAYLRILCLDKMSKNGGIEHLEKLKILTDNFILHYQAMDKDEEYNEVYEIAKRIKSIDPLVMFQDDFSSNDNKWCEGNTVDYEFKIINGKYRIESKKGGRTCSIPLQINTDSNFEISATISKISGTDGYYFGMILGSNTSNGYHHFAAIAGNGHYIFADNGIKPTDLIGNITTNNAVITGNATNKITIRKKDNLYKLYINGHLMGETPYKKFFGDYLGFQLSSGAESLVIEVDNLIIQKLN